jgi:hypothetical protein
MNVITDIVQGVLHYSNYIGGVLDIFRTGTPTGGSCKTTRRGHSVRVPQIP